MIEVEYIFGILDRIDKRFVKKFYEKSWKDNIKMCMRAPDSEDVN